MVSFASPLFWQIHYLVTNLSKKNFKLNVAELNQLVGLYGEDARIFLLNCLVKDIDFRDARGQQKDALKIQLLTHEIAQASSKPNFTTFICEAIEGSANDSTKSRSPRGVTEEYLTNFCRALKLSVPQQVTIGLSFAQGENLESAREAVKFLKYKIPEISSCGSKLPSDVLHALVFVLRMKEDFQSEVAETDSFLASISAAHLNDMNAMEMAPLTLGDPDYVDCLAITEPDLVSRLVSDVTANCVFYELMEDVGYACTSSPRAFRTLLAEAGLQHAPTIPPVQVAGMLSMLARSFGQLKPEQGATLLASLPFVCDASMSAADYDGGDAAAMTPASNPFDNTKDNWDLDVITEVFHKDYASIKWAKVAEKLDRDDLVLTNPTQLRVLVLAFQKLSQSKFKLATLLQPWKHSRAQLSVLKAAIESPPEVLSFLESPRKLEKFEGADASQVPKNGVWFSLDVVETLLTLAEKDLYADVRRVLEPAMKQCPDVLIANVARAVPRWNGLRDDVFADLLATYILGRPNAPAILRHLWSVAPKLVLAASVRCFYAAGSPQIVSRLFALLRNTGDAFASAIHSNYFSFALSLAVMGANHDVLALDAWLVERLAAQRTAFAAACLAFVHRHYARAIPKASVTPASSHALSIESLATVLKCLVATQMPPTLAIELKRVLALCMDAHPVISQAASSSSTIATTASTTPMPQPDLTLVSTSTTTTNAAASTVVATNDLAQPPPPPPPAITAEMIEEQANAYFQQIYTSEQNINDVVAMLKRFQSSRDERERQIFYCMIHNLFDEYRFFPRYPEMELRITGVLFGKLIEYQVLPPNFLQTALRSVLESLREPVTSKFFFFGAVALQQFVPRLKELPAYCANLAQIPHLHQALPEIIRVVTQITRAAGFKPGDVDVSDATGNGTGTGISPTTTTAASPAKPHPVTPRKSESDLLAGSRAAALGIQIPAASPTAAAIATTAASSSSSPAPSPTQQQQQPVPPVSPPAVLPIGHIFHASSELDDDDLETMVQPDESVQDRIHFIVNNMSISNLDAKIPEVRKLLLDSYHAWMAQYLVVKRISTQPNYHAVFLVFIEKLHRPALESEILKRTLFNARKLLTSGTITTNSQQRSLLKNLGSWLGVFTLARNKPLLQRDLDVKELLYVGYETGHLIAVTPFVAKILEGCKKSKIFKPPNPWLMGMIHAMSEIYDVADLKLNLKFEIEVLFKQFKLNVEDQRKAHLLHTRAAPPRHGNPDFNVKAPPKPTTSAGLGLGMGVGMGMGPGAMRSATPPPGGSKLSAMLTKSISTPGVSAPGAGATTPGKQASSSILGGLKKLPSEFTPSSSPPPAGAGAGGAGSTASAANVSNESTVIPNLASYVVVNPDLPLHNVNLRRLVPLAVDRAIREVISPVVERSVTIACITARELVLKDFATEPDDAKLRKAAHLTVASLSGSLALITAKEPLRNSIATHLRALIPASAGDPQQIENVIQVCSNENTDLGCMLIEKASSEKAIRDIDEALAAAYASRRRFQQTSASKDTIHFFEGTAHQPPPNLPDLFKPRVGGVPHAQLVVYEAFLRLPRSVAMPRTPVDAASDGTLAASGGGVSVAAALDRFAGLMEKFELFVQNVVRQARELPSLAAIPPESDVFAVLREVRALGAAVKPALREEACLKIGHRIVKCVYELGGGRGDELFLEILVSSLDALAQSCDKLKKEVVGWILRSPVEDKLKLHCEVMIALVRFKVVELNEFDVYLTRNMERNSVAIEFAVHLVRQCLPMDHVALAKQLPNTLDALQRIVERHGGAAANKNVQILAALLDQARAKTVAAVTARGPGSIGKPASGSIGGPGSIGKPVPAASGGTSGGSALPPPPSAQEHAAFRHTVSNALEHWIAIYKEPSSNAKIHAQYIQMLKQYGLLTDDESVSLFFRFGTELCVDACLKTANSSTSPTMKPAELNYGVVDALTHLMVLLIKFLDPSAKLQVLNHAVGAIANVLVAAHDLARKKKAPAFDQRVFFRMFANLMKDLTVQEPALDAIHLQVLNTFASAYNTLQPSMLPGFVFAWTELVAHRCFMPLLLRAKQQRGWQILHRLLMNLFVFLEPFLRHATTHQLSGAVAALYKGAMRIVLVLLHDYPEFLADFYASFCDVLPAAAVQLRNVILSAFARSMRLPDPLTLGLQVSQLPEVGVSPRLMPAWGAALAYNGIKEYVDEFLRATSNRAAVFPAELRVKLLRAPAQLERDPTACKYAVPALNALVLYLGKEAIVDMASGHTSTSSAASATSTGATADAATTSKFEQSASMDVFRFLADELDAEGRYWYFSALANHLRYPNAHTHYFSCVILYLFSNSTNKLVKEQITRVLIERLIANRPHPWGLLVTFIELIRNKSYRFWEQEYLECSSEIKEVFDDVARTCLGSAIATSRSE